MSEGQHAGLIVDFYGVLTDGLDDAMRSWTDEDGVDYAHFRAVMSDWLGESGRRAATFNPVHALERGELEVPHFEEQLAERLRRSDGSDLPAHGLVRRMFGRFQHAHDMAGLVRRAHAAGIRTALLSNSWGDQYLRTGWEDMFDAVVISGEVGMRKPDSDIFELTLAKLGLPAAKCVFVDDHESNVLAARALGITAMLHQDYDETAAALEDIFGLPLAD